VIDPSSLAISPDGRLYISSKWGNNICWVDPKTNDAAAVLCGSGAPESKDGDFSHCSFNAPSAICFLSDGKMLVAESGALRMVDLDSRQVTTFCDHIPIPFECDAARQQIIALEEDWDGGILALVCCECLAGRLKFCF
jgi:WD40 repeat protein